MSYYPQVGMIQRRHVDIGVTSFFATIKRQEVVDFSPILTMQSKLVRKLSL